MQITIIQGAFFPVPPLLGGAVEKMWYSLAKEFVDLGHEVSYISRRFPGLKDEDKHEGISHTRVRGYASPNSMFRLKLLDLIYSLRAVRVVKKTTDVVVTNTFWAPLIINRSLKEKVYVDVQRMPKGQMWVYKKVGGIRANSTPVATAIESELKCGNTGLVRMIPNPIPFKTPSGSSFSKEETILYCGRVHPEKGIHLLLEAFGRIQTNWKLRIVGPWQIEYGGGGLSYLNKLRKESEGTKVEFVGPVFDEVCLSTEYKKASLFVYPSLAEKGETFGLAPLEAMAWGCVPIVSSLDCFRDFIHHGQNGIIFDHRNSDPPSELADVLNRLILDPAQISTLAERSIKVRETHSTFSIARQFVADFQRLSSAAS